GQSSGGAGVAVGCLGDFEPRAVAVRPADYCRAEQVAVGVGDQAAVRIATIDSVDVEADQGGRSAGVAGSGLDDLENRTSVVVTNVVCRTTLGCRAEQVALGISNQTAERLGTVGSVEADQGGGGAGVAGSGLD